MSGFLRQRHRETIAIWRRKASRKTHPFVHPVPASMDRNPRAAKEAEG
jgi:hypothetical protein